MMDLEFEECGWCGHSVAFGSGKFVNRIPASTTLSETVWAGFIEYRHLPQDSEVSCFLCEKCELGDNEIVGEIYK